MTKKDVKDFDTLEVYYTQVRKIKFDEAVRIESFDDIYNNLFTLERDRRGSQQPTYFMRGKIHCTAGRYRSIEDFIKLCKKYFPDKTLKDIFTYLKEKEERYLESRLMQCFRYCPNIKKYNYAGVQPVAYVSARSINDYSLKDLAPGLRAGDTVAAILT